MKRTLHSTFIMKVYFIQFQQFIDSCFSIMTLVILILYLLLISTYENALTCPDGHFWNIQKNVCSPCGLHCKNCNHTHCLQCENFPNYQFDQQINECSKINLLSHRRFLVDCFNDANCDICVASGGGNNPCTLCLEGFGPDGAGRCKACHSSCKTCDAPNNAGNCLTCFSSDFLQTSTSHCKQCDNQYGNRCLQCTQANCTRCRSGYYPISGYPGCAACPSNCLICTSLGCQQCDQFYQLNVNQTCSDICGDSHNINLPCDLPLGIAFDGCSDNCQIENNFVCDITNFKTDCFYQGVVNMTMSSMDRYLDSNMIEMIVNLYPPLYAFQSTNLYELFSINDSDLIIQTLSYSNGNLIMKVEFTTTVINRPFQILFNPNASSDSHINQAQQNYLDSTIVTQIPSIYYSSQTYTIAKVLAVFCILIVVLSYLICIIGIGSKRLAGLQLMFLLQFTWVSLLWLPNFMPITFYPAISLKYSSGFNILIEKYSYSSTLPIQTMSFSIDALHFNNNFNLSLIFYALPLFFAIVFKAASLSGKYREKTISKYQFCLQMAMYGTMFNFIGFLVFSIIFFSTGQKTSASSFIAFIFAFLVTSGVLVKFYFDPDPFDRFRYEFKRENLAMNHIYFHVLNILMMVLFLCLIFTAPWVCCISPLLLLAYTLIYRPYEEFSQNLRSAYFQFVIALTGGFRTYYISSSVQWRFSDQSALFLVLLLCLFLIPAIIWSYVSVIRSYCNKYNVEKNPKKQEINYVLFEDLKFIKQLANTQKLLQIENFIKTKRENVEENGGDQIINKNKKEEDDQQELTRKRQLARNIAREIKIQKINDKLSSERKQYQLNNFENQQKNERINQRNIKQRKEIDEKKFQRAVGIELSHLENQKSSRVIKDEKKAFKIETQFIFQNLFNYGGSLSIPQFPIPQVSREEDNNVSNKTIKEEESESEEEEKEAQSSKQRIQINTEEIEKDEKIKQALSKEINFIKLKMGEKLTKQVKYRHIESYNKIQ